MMFVAISVVAVLLGGLIWFVMFLSRLPQGVELVSQITPSTSGDKVAFAAYHGGYDDKWSGVRDFILQYTGRNAYPEYVRLTLLDISRGDTSDLGAGEVAGRLIAWATGDSLLAYVSGEFRANDDRKLGPDGSYSVETAQGSGLPLGTYHVSVGPPQIEFSLGPAVEPPPNPKTYENIPQKYRRPETSGLTLTVEEGYNRLDVDMGHEGTGIE